MAWDPKELRQVFDTFDSDGSGEVDCKELHHAMQMLGVKCNINSAKKVLGKIDKNGNGQIDWDEFSTFFKTISSTDEIKQLLSKENQRYFEHKERVEKDLAFAKTFVIPPAKNMVKKCIGHNESLEKVAWLSDNLLLAGSSNGVVCIWDVLKERPQVMRLSSKVPQLRPEKQFTIDVKKTAIYSMAVSGDATSVLAGLGNVEKGNVSLWNIENGNLVQELGGQNTAVYACDFSPDCRQAASGSQRGSICLHDLERPDTPILSWSGHCSVVHSVAFRGASSDRGILCSASADGAVKIFDTRSREPGDPESPETIAIIPDAAASETVAQALFRGENEVISCGEDYCIKRWDQRALKKGCVTAYFGHVSPVRCIALSSDERFIVSGTHNGSVRVWLADEKGLLDEKEQEAMRALSTTKQKKSAQQELFESGEMDAAMLQEFKALGPRVEELEADLSKWRQVIADRTSLNCTQAVLTLDSPTLPMSSLAWRDVGEKALIATACQDPFVRLFDVDACSLTENVGPPRMLSPMPSPRGQEQ